MTKLVPASPALLAWSFHLCSFVVLFAFVWKRKGQQGRIPGSMLVSLEHSQAGTWKIVNYALKLFFLFRSWICPNWLMTPSIKLTTFVYRIEKSLSKYCLHGKRGSTLGTFKNQYVLSICLICVCVRIYVYALFCLF